MVPTTWTALLLLTVAVLPGAMFTFGFERQAGAFRVTLADRVLRFVAASALFDLAYAWPAYGLYRWVLSSTRFDLGQFAVAWCGAVSGVGLPLLLGSVLGGLYVTRGKRTGWSGVRRWLPPERESRVLRAALGRDRAPRAWDQYFAQRPTTYLRVRRQDGGWLGGLFAASSYAGVFPHDRDLLLEEVWPVDEQGAFGDAPLGYSAYVPADTIAYVEFVGPGPVPGGAR